MQYIKPPSPRMLEHQMAMLKCMEADPEVNWNLVMIKLGMNRRSAQSIWCRLKRQYEIRSGDRSRAPVPTGRDLQVILTIITCFHTVPKVNYSAMMQVANLSRRSAQSIVCRLKKNYFK
ncbi:hypothetical protein FHL15_005426 [Xylaria flabelliformis]|uniref:Uncharacterized protein n=1 Tax=Xylaria flabelliformis TaxID=2512241 RepID=A0A553I0L4_9PEZI|nr:hypothetical protein FHL15_005426 [Xylaria flabelliformis]